MSARTFKRIAVLTSGGDAPGMNAAIRAVTRAGLGCGWEVFGVRHGYKGLLTGDIVPLGARDVGGIMQQGGTVLGSARCTEWTTVEGRQQGLAELARRGIDALVVIGGNGSQTGAWELDRMGFPVVGVASTIDNDLAGSDITIGVDTALNIALEAIDRIKTTASSHMRAFLVEVMGRRCGYLALMAGIAGGAEIILIPEIDMSPEEVATAMRAAYDRGKPHAIAVVAEGARYNSAALVAYFCEHQARLGFDLRVTTLGHTQRGGAPTAYDRLLATRLGAGAAAALNRGETGVICGTIRGLVTTTPLADIVGKQKPIDPALFDLASLLDR
jgi:6-phosphofructokinase 1